MSDVASSGVHDQRQHAVMFLCDVGMANNPERPYRGEYRAYGPAAITGWVCDRGVLQGTFGKELDGFFDFTVVHRMTCPDGTSGFEVTLQVKMYDPMHTFFEWQLADGFGHHDGLTGAGTGVGTESRLGRDVIRDHLFGSVVQAS